jgi:dienelactone hydrolase
MKRLPLVLCALALFTFGSAASVFADTRSDFLKLIDRPRVALAPETRDAPPSDGLVHSAFSYASSADIRVPGILVKSASSSGRRPVVIALHGTGGTKQSDAAFLADLAKAGFVAVAIDAPYHGARSKAGKGSADYLDAIARTFRTGQEHPFYFDTAWDVMRLIDYLETRDDVDAKRIGLFGISKGGIETYLTAAVDSRVAAAVPCIGVQSFRWAVENNSWQSRIGTIQAAFDAAAKESGVEKPGVDFVRRFYDRVAPGLDGKFDAPVMLPLIAPRPLFSINGETDDRTPLPGLQLCTDAARAAYRAAGADEKFVQLIQPKTGHKVSPTSYVAARDWFVRWLKP